MEPRSGTLAVDLPDQGDGCAERFARANAGKADLIRVGRLATIFVALAWPALAQDVPLSEGAVVTAELIAPTDRYDHGVLGDAVEWGGLRLGINTCIGCNHNKSYK